MQKLFFKKNNQTDKDYFLKYYTKPKSQDNIMDFNHINVLWFCIVKHNKQSCKSNMTKGDHIDHLVLHTGKKLTSSIWNPTNLKQKANHTEQMGKWYRQDIEKIQTRKYKRFSNICKVLRVTSNIKRNSNHN